MPREIKFRLWSPKIRTFYYWGFISDGGFPCFAGIPDGMMKYAMENSEQFTGLKDKVNEKEIYEGDIVRHQNGFVYVVEWSSLNAWWCLVQVRDNAVPYTGGIMGQDIWRCEVIGNIHERPYRLVTTEDAKR